ncbi:S1 family peptidase [Gigaspora margarita]|uniref:S1 family peptidase n=1 Tax=Gigaspora margarita TaxID=4874 RepID=A0A8H4EUX4_GIGMA|nr:S1 family peptidase [Gigaspora margarita]
MKNFYFLINLLLIIFTIQKHFIIYAQEPLASLWGINDTEIPRYLNIEKNLTLLDKIVKPFLNDSSFGGTWIDVKLNKVFINTVNLSQVPIIKSLPELKTYLDFLEFQPANNSLEYLKYSFNQIISILVSEYKPHNIFISIKPKDNNVVIALGLDENDEINQKFINATLHYGPKIRYLPSKNSSILRRADDREKIQVRLSGGDNIVGDSGLCSVGFLARKHCGPPCIKRKKDYIVTAGHCVSSLNVRFNHFVDGDAFFVGTMVSFSKNKYDYGLINIRKMDKRLKIRPSIRNFGSQDRELLITDSIPASSHGAHLCKSGAKTKLTCGYIESFNGVFTDINDIILIDLIFTNSLSNEGDSGGPVFYFFRFTFSESSWH